MADYIKFRNEILLDIELPFEEEYSKLNEFFKEGNYSENDFYNFRFFI